MAGLNPQTPWPTEMTYHQASRRLDVSFDDGKSYQFSAEYLRVLSPSAEVVGHGPGQEVLQVGKRQVGIDEITPVGQYAIRLKFSDGHDTGIYSWDYLKGLGVDQAENWARYLNRLEAAGKSRDQE